MATDATVSTPQPSSKRLAHEKGRQENLAAFLHMRVVRLSEPYSSCKPLIYNETENQNSVLFPHLFPRFDVATPIFELFGNSRHSSQPPARTLKRISACCAVATMKPEARPACCRRRLFQQVKHHGPALASVLQAAPAPPGQARAARRWPAPDAKKPAHWRALRLSPSLGLSMLGQDSGASW